MQGVVTAARAVARRAASGRPAEPRIGAAGSGWAAPRCPVCQGLDACGQGCGPVTNGTSCATSSGYPGSCLTGSCVCTPSCSGNACGAADGCGGTCCSGSGCGAQTCGTCQAA